MRTRREFLKLLPLSAAGAWTGGAGLTSLLVSRPSRAEAAQAGGPASRPFIMVTLGDSIMWGQGLPESMKFRNIVAGWIQGHLGGRPVRQFAFAHSGAQILVNSGETDYAPNLSGEIPRSYPSVTLQTNMAQSALASAPLNFTSADVDLVLVDGGINDVGVPSILNPLNSSGGIGQLAHTVCASRMNLLLNGGCASYPCSQLFPGVLKMFPKAAVIVLGYYQIASKLTDPGELTAYASAIGALSGGVPGALIGGVLSLANIDQLVNNSVAWKEETDAGFRQLVGAANQQNGLPYRVGFASPAFSDDNCFAAPHSCLFNLSPFNGFAGDESGGLAGLNEPTQQPVDDVQWTRARACAAAGRKEPWCPDACMGHPNPFGARAYSDAILGAIFNLAPYLATRGLIENPACAGLRAQETVAAGQVRRVQDLLTQMGKEQQACQAGIGPDGRREPSYKPKQCGALENEAEKKKLSVLMEQANAQLAVIRRQKLQAGCWY